MLYHFSSGACWLIRFITAVLEKRKRAIGALPLDMLEEKKHNLLATQKKDQWIISHSIQRANCNVNRLCRAHAHLLTALATVHEV